MKIKYCILFFLLTAASSITSQSVSDENLAREYYRQGDFQKASTLFEGIYKKKKVKSIYDKYVDCLIKIESYKKAEKTIKSFYKQNKNPSILIDLGKIYELKKENELSIETFELALKEAKKNNRFLATVGSKFFKEKKYEFALSAYLLANKENPRATYLIQIANIYSHLADIESMYEKLIELIKKYPNYFQTSKNMLRRTISEDEGNDNNKKLKKILLKNIQKENSYEVSKILVWLFLQEKKFNQALKYEISIDKTSFNNSMEIISLCDVAFSNEDYETALEGLNYILESHHENSYEYEYSSLQILDMEFQILENKKLKKDSEIKDLVKAHNEALDFFGIKSETIFTLKNYCNLLAIYLDEENKAIQILENTIQNKGLDKYDIAICKMELAKILISNGDIWESSLLYSQVEKEFKEDVIGQTAKFEKIKINYYKGDFEWAQNQLKVLKRSTSKLISNNAIKLSLLISDNLNLDTTNLALLEYAKAELLFEQKKYADCLKTLNDLEISFPNHTLIDEVLFKKFDVFIKIKEYTNALNALHEICEKYYYDILYDDALFYQARIYEDIIDDKIKAKEKYEELLLKTPNSIFINKARKRYRLLRTNNLLKL
ncbi:MAG: hypothetical protein CMP56_04385 [Flavobacteriales bacterium]|nr:hypothetical protein [Flavobacteriales bacterium]